MDTLIFVLYLALGGVILSPFVIFCGCVISSFYLDKKEKNSIQTLKSVGDFLQNTGQLLAKKDEKS